MVTGPLTHTNPHPAQSSAVFRPLHHPQLREGRKPCNGPQKWIHFWGKYFFLNSAVITSMLHYRNGPLEKPWGRCKTRHWRRLWKPLQLSVRIVHLCTRMRSFVIVHRRWTLSIKLNSSAEAPEPIYRYSRPQKLRRRPGLRGRVVNSSLSAGTRKEKLRQWPLSLAFARKHWTESDWIPCSTTQQYV